MSRRGNGLSAEAYTPLIDLAPELADAMLSALREAGIAAYAAESDSGTDPRLERLYVDDAMESAAEDILHEHLSRLQEERRSETDRPATEERDEEAIWAEIVAGFDSEVDEGSAPWPEQENVAPDEEGHDRTGRLPTARLIRSDDEPGVMDEEDDEEGHYIPPPPPPLPSGDPVTRGAWVALVGGPLYLLLTVILGWEVPGWAAFLAVASFIGGFVALVLRMGDEPRDPDDGAVI